MEMENNREKGWTCRENVVYSRTMRMNSHYMSRLSRQLMTLLALLLGWQMEAKADSQRHEEKLVDIGPAHERQQGAMLSDWQHLYRLCNSRPQRLTHSSSSPPTTGKGCGPAANVPATHHSLVPYLWKHGPKARGFQFDASSRNYIFALGHIIR